MKTNPEIARYSRFQRTGVKNIRQYADSVRDDYLSIRKHLPAVCTDILDIGCGMAGIGIMLTRHYHGECNLHLLDKDGVSDNLRYGYHEEASHYNSLAVTREFLILNQVNPVNIFTYDVSKNEFPAIKAQIILSLISCGFHYPVCTYLEQIREMSSGIVVLDIRKGTDQMKQLADSFRHVETIADYRKYERVLMK